ncbi:MAG: ABC transporter permease, partial [Solirubrobacteraceae bacterium]
MASRYLQAALATAKRDAAIFFSYRLRMASELLGMFFTLTIFYYVAKLIRPGAVGPHAHYYVFVVVGIVTMAVLESALNLIGMVRLELVAGNFERVLVSPFGPVAGAISMVAFPLVNAILFAAATLALAAGVFGMPLRLAGIPLALAVAGLGGLAFAAIGLMGGAYFPVSLCPGWIRWGTAIQPLTPAVDLLRHLLTGAASPQPAWLDVVKLGGFAVVLTPLACAVLWQALRYARRRGTIME